MTDTVRLNLDPDYFPLLEGFKLRYEHTSTEFEGVETVETVYGEVKAFRDDAECLVTLTRSRGGARPTLETYRVVRDAKRLYAEGGVLRIPRVEFVRPPVAGKSWVEAPNRHVIAASDARIEVPAGRFGRCLRVNTFLAGGDGGSAIRYYAPGLGYVYEEYSDEAWGSRVKLLGFEPPGRKLA